MQQQAQAQAEQQATVNLIQKRAAESQQIINDAKRLQFSAIVAVDEAGGFAKDGKIPWDYPSDLKWFMKMTKGHICVMGRATYDELMSRPGASDRVDILPGRKSFVVTSSPLPKDNAVAISTLSDVDKHVSFEEIDSGKTVFFIGGERIYSEGIAKCNKVYVSVINKRFDTDRHFPTKYLTANFNVENVDRDTGSQDLVFTTWVRKQ